MFEETNQTEEMMLPDNLFPSDEEMMFEEEIAEEVAPNEGEVTTEAEELVAEEVSPEATPADVEKFLRIKYNGEERDLAEEEARTLAQKGMNYDKVLGERDNLTGIIDQYAKASNMTRDQFIDFLKMNLANYEEGAEVDNLRKSYPGASDDVLKAIADRDKKIRETEEKEREESNRKAEEEKNLRPWLDFYSRHSDITYENLDPEMLRLVKEENYSPEEAFLRLENDKLKAGADVARQNKENLDRAIGSARGNGGKVKKDPFLEGFNG